MVNKLKMSGIAQRMAVAFVAFLMACVLLPATAFAVSIDVYTTSTGDADDYAKIGEVNLTNMMTDISANQEIDRYGYMYKKDGVWNVIGTQKYVLVDTALSIAGSKWATGSELYFYALSNNESVEYTKAAMSYNDLHAGSIFYGATGATGNLVSNNAYNVVTPGAIFSLDPTKVTVSTTAATALNGISTFSSTNAPRLLWGFSSTSPSSTAGKRFPSNITRVYVKAAGDDAPFDLD